MIGKILSFIRKHDNFLCSGHVRSDGDALGAQLALNSVLRKMGRRSHVVCDHGALPEYRFLPGSENVGADPSALRKSYGGVFTCDSGSWRRLERISAALPREKIAIVNIDHHASNERFGDINWVDPTYSSTGEMILDLAKGAKVKLDRSIATNVYTAIVTDTGSFRFSNTTVATHRNAAECLANGVRPADITKLLYRQKTLPQLKYSSIVAREMKMTGDGQVAWVALTPAMSREARFVPADTQEFMDTMMSLKTVRACILFRAGDGIVKVSWRTSPGIDGIALASPFGGGGHPRASGASVPGTLPQVEKKIVKLTVAAAKNDA